MLLPVCSWTSLPAKPASAGMRSWSLAHGCGAAAVVPARVRVLWAFGVRAAAVRVLGTKPWLHVWLRANILG